MESSPNEDSVETNKSSGNENEKLASKGKTYKENSSKRKGTDNHKKGSKILTKKFGKKSKTPQASANFKSKPKLKENAKKKSGKDNKVD